MQTKVALRIAIVAEWSLVIATIVLSFVLEDSLPSPLKEYVKAGADREIQPSDIAGLLGGSIVIVAALIASAGLFLLKKWARWLYLAATLVGYALTFFAGPSVEHPLSAGLDDISAAVSGVILGIAFFTGVLEKADSPVNPSAGNGA